MFALRATLYELRFVTSRKTINIIKYSKRLLCSQVSDNVKSERLSSYVSYPYSYAFGRSTKQLEYLSLGEVLEQQASKGKSTTKVISCHEKIEKSVSQFNDDVNKLTKSLYTTLGLKRGDVAGIWSCNSYAWLVIQYACARLGVVLCTVNPVYKVPELEFALEKARIKVLFQPGKGSDQESINNYRELIVDERIKKAKQRNDKNSIILEHVVFMDGKNESNGTILDNVSTHTLSALMSNDGVVDKQLIQRVSTDDAATIMFTSGTTGKPKGATLSHFTVVNNALLAGNKLGFTEISDASICLPLPLFHCFAAVLGSITSVTIPTDLVLTGYRFDSKTIVEAICKHNCTHIMLTPTMIIDILDYIEKNNVKVTSLKGVLIGGAPTPVEVAHRITRVIPSATDVRIGYGATELGPCTTASHVEDSVERRMETVGCPLDFVEVKIVNPQTYEITKIGEQGELLARGHNVMLGYWDEEQKTKEAVDASGWYKTGDLATMDKYGYVKIIGRTKEMIIRGGENVYPREVEELLHTHPQILDAYVIGVPDERVGEEICAWIKLRDNSVKLTEKDIKQFCKDKISYFKIPRYILFVDGFPLTSTGKAQKFIMREKSCEMLGLKEL